MSITRRDLLKLGATAGAAIAGGASTDAYAATPRRIGPSILQGATDDSRTQFSVVHQAGVELSFEAADPMGNVHSPERIDRITSRGQPTEITKVYFAGLRSGVEYRLNVFESATLTLIDERIFGLLSPGKDQLRFAICSCMDEFLHEPEIWRDLVAQQPDFIIFAGDSTYCDYGRSGDRGAGRLWRRFAEARATLEIYFSKRLIPILATWDDHDFGLNDSGREFPFVSDSQVNFMNFFAMNPEFCSNLQRGPGVSSAVQFKGQQFILMDDRSWRIAGHSRDRYGHWGREQEEWLLSRVAEFDGMSWIVNGSQIFPQLIFKESFSGDHPVQFEAFKKGIAETKRRIALISGDVHYSEISRIEREAFGFETFELTSSSIHSDKFGPLPGISNHPRRIAAAGDRNYLLVNSRDAGEGCLFTVESRSAGGQINFILNLEI